MREKKDLIWINDNFPQCSILHAKLKSQLDVILNHWQKRM